VLYPAHPRTNPSLPQNLTPGLDHAAANIARCAACLAWNLGNRCLRCVSTTVFAFSDWMGQLCQTLQQCIYLHAACGPACTNEHTGQVGPGRPGIHAGPLAGHLDLNCVLASWDLVSECIFGWWVHASYCNSKSKNDCHAISVSVNWSGMDRTSCQVRLGRQMHVEGTTRVHASHLWLAVNNGMHSYQLQMAFNERGCRGRW